MKFFTLFDPKSEWNFVGKIPAALAIAATVPVIFILSTLFLGFPFGLDFTGGTEMQVKFDKSVSDVEVRETLSELGFDKTKVQQFGKSEDNEMLIRIARVSSLTDENINNMKSAIEADFDKIKNGADATPDKIRLEFAAEEGDRVSIWLPEPKPATAGPKSTDANAIGDALTKIAESINLADAEAAKMHKVLSAGVLAKLSKMGFDRSAVTAAAKAAEWTVTAGSDLTVEPPFAPARAQDQAMKAQSALLAKLLDEKSGVKLRRSKRVGDDEESFDGAVIQSEPYQGMVKYIVNFRGVSGDIERALAAKFGSAKILKVDFVDSTAAQQLQTGGVLAVLYALFFILIYVAVRFDFSFGPGAIVALIHDALGALAVFPIFRIEFELASVAAVLTVVGYSINNTIVIYDRIRETMPDESAKRLSDEEVRKNVNRAINDTFSRTVNTTLTTLMASLALFFFAGGTVQNFAAVLSVGIVLGAFSSTFLAPATYLFFRKVLHRPEAEEQAKAKTGLSREDKARGVV